VSSVRIYLEGGCLREEFGDVQFRKASLRWFRPEVPLYLRPLFDVVTEHGVLIVNKMPFGEAWKL